MRREYPNGTKSGIGERTRGEESIERQRQTEIRIGAHRAMDEGSASPSGFWLFSDTTRHGHSTHDVRACVRAYGGGRILPSVDPLGELVAFQGPPKLTALDISPLHIPRHFHQQRSDVTRGALQERKKNQPQRQRDATSAARDIHSRAKKPRALSRARDFYQSLLLSFACGQIRGLTAVYQAADWSIVGHGA
jgi:hypothetical protein